MKYSRGRIIALAILSVTMAFALFCTGFIFVGWRNSSSRAAGETSGSANSVPGFDDLYQRIPFDAVDTGSVTLGANTQLTLTEERYSRDVLTNFLNMGSKQSYVELQNQSRHENYPYPIYSNADMKKIAGGFGNTMQIPVVMLDSTRYDDVVLFELTNLVSTPTEVSITRDGVSLNDNFRSVDSSLGKDYVYSGAPKYTLTAKSTVITDSGGNALLNVIFKPDNSVTDKYVVEVRDLNGSFLYIEKTTGQFEQLQTIAEGTTRLYNDLNEYVYEVVRSGDEIKVYNNSDILLGTTTYKKSENQLVSYEIGAVGYNGNAVRGMFQEQGFYQISFKQKIATGDGVVTELDIAFAFVIVDKINYEKFPRFNLENRANGQAEIYNFSYENEYPVVEYSSLFFDVDIQTAVEYAENDPDVAQRELRFYNIGEYQMVSRLQYYNAYLASRDHEFSKRGVSQGVVRLNRYTQYASILNIYGFQAYYGGQHTDSKFDGPLPFFDSADSNVSSDISKLVRESNMTAGNAGYDYTTMRVSDALQYSNQLANYLTNQGVKPVRTNFPPVKIKGNVLHATGAGMNGEKAVVLSTVAFRAAYGVGNVGQWVSSTMEVGAPFEEAGQYVVTTYFKVNQSICQQTFFFEIVNSAKIAFEVTDAIGNTKTYYAGDLELGSRILSGKNVRISYEGNTTLGQFEVPPTITLEAAQLGSYSYSHLYIPTKEGGAFDFMLTPLQYRLTVEYGAHNKSASVFEIVVDNTAATGIKANTAAKKLDKLPANVAVVGKGKVNLTWDAKASGINFTNVRSKFYEIQQENLDTDPNADRNYFEINDGNLNKVTNLYAAYSFVNDPSIPNNGYEPVKTETGWTLQETFELPGLYIFTLVDEVGNETEFILLIDQTTPTFVQSGVKNTTASNAVNFYEDVGVYVGFGKNKLIPGSYFIFQERESFLTEEAKILVNDYRDGILQSAIKVGIARVEYSKSGEEYQDLDLSKNNGYMFLNEEGTYYFRVTDELGNRGEYYIILTHDNSLGMIYADAVRPIISAEGTDVGRGFIADQPNINTSLVTSTGGMTNRDYVSFSFQQKAGNFNVKEIYLQYYPLVYDVRAANYPFADELVNAPVANGLLVFANQTSDGLIYTYQPGDEAKDTIRLALFNLKTTTPSGMYVITRKYSLYDKNGKDTAARDYYFIVDDQKMLHYDKDKFQTKLKVEFANKPNSSNSKTATAGIIHSNDNQLSSDRTAWVTGFSSKYSWRHVNGIQYTLYKDNTNYVAGHEDLSLNDRYSFTFPALMPRFSYVNNYQTYELGTGNGTWAIGDPASSAESSIYKLLIRDDARNISCMLVNGSLTELIDQENAPTSANYDYLTLDLELGHGTKAEIQISEDKVISNNQMQYDGDSYYYIVDPDMIDELKFSFKSDPNSMYTDVDLHATMATWTAEGFLDPFSINLPTPVAGKYTFDLMASYLDDVMIENGSSLAVNLISKDGTVTKYKILFDATNPNYNLTRVRDNDNLACEISLNELPADYIYGLTEDFVFESDNHNNPYLETQIITYREIDYSGEGIQTAVPFKLYRGANGEERIPFARLVGLRDNEMKYFIITETDYAGHTTSYRVQVQGEKYVNNISFIGAITDEEDEIQIGCEMRASKSSIHQFFLSNSSFKFESGDDYYTVLGSTATWHIGNDVGSGAKSEESLINALDSWINRATENGTKCSYTLYDRIGEKEVFEFYNIRESAAKIQLDCYQASAGSSVILTSVTNYDELPKILFDDSLASLFKMSIKDITTNDTPTEVYFSLDGTPIQGFDVSHDLIVTVTDPFGRVSLTEYHQQKDSSIIFNVNGNTVTENDVVYVGDQRGVSFSYLRTAYNVLIYDAGTGEVMSNLQSFISNDMVSYTFVPKKGATTIEQYRIVATGRASGAVLFDKTFVFDTRLPEVQWKNASDQPISVEGQTFVSDVCFDISNNLVPLSFPVTVSYTRSYKDKVERVTLKPGMQKITFKQPGQYTVTLRNTVWAEKTYSFEIEQVDDNLVQVFDDGKQLQASPSQYEFMSESLNIPRYIFTTTGGTAITDYLSHGLEIKIGQTNRELAGNQETGTDYYYYDFGHNTLVWRLAFCLGESNGVKLYDNPIYFATTGVITGELNAAGNSGSSISLILNGNPDSKVSSNSFLIEPSQTTYHLINDDFMKAHDEKVEVKLYCDQTVMRDSTSNLPCYMGDGNVIVVDCYYNGKLVKTLIGDALDQVFTISRYSAGYYEFVVHDLVGNNLYFGSSKNKNDVNYRQERYMLIVMTKPMVLINDKQPVNGMIYNDEVELKLINYGNNFLAKIYADKVAADGQYFEKYFCITKIEGTYTGSKGKEEILLNTDGKQTVFFWNKSGSYRIKVTYRVSENVFDNLEAEYQFQIIPAQTIRESFSMPIYPDIQIASVTRNGYLIHDFDDLKVNENMEFNADINPGSYVVTLKTFDGLLQEFVTHDVKFNIQHKTNSASNCFVLSSGSGTATTGEVILYYNPYWLFATQGKVTIYLYRDYAEVEQVTVDESVLENINLNTQELFKSSDAGLYTVVVRDAEGDPVYMDSWTVNAEQSTFGYVILAVVCAIAGIALLIFLRMRRKMSTK